MKGSIVSIILGVCLLPPLFAAEPTPIRDWKSKAGTSFSGRATALNGELVTLEGLDGRSLTVPISKFEADDQALLAEHFGSGAQPAAPGVSAASPQLAHPLGEAVGPIDAGGGSNYFVYLPTTLKAGQKAPLLLYTGSGGGSAGSVNAFKEAAELCGWIIAASVESKNGQGLDENSSHADRCLQHLQEKLPIDPKRIYFSGNSGGARMAYHHADRHQSPGVVGVIAGAQANEIARGRHYFFISGAFDYNRYDTSKSFAKAGRSAAMRFHPGGHGDGPEWMRCEGLIWLEGMWMRRAKDPEKANYEAAVLSWLSQLKIESPGRAASWVAFLDEGGVSSANSATLAALEKELAAEPDSARYAAALVEMEKLAAKIFNDGPNGAPACFNHTDKTIQREVGKLSEKYAGLPWISEILEAMKKPTDQG